MANDSPNLYAETVASVDVPVLTMVGEHDWYIDSARAERHGRESYEASSDATSEIIPAIGHMVLHHENRFQVRERIDSWLVERNL